MFKMFFLVMGIFPGLLFSYYSQCGQDKYLNEYFFQNRKTGVFVEIGAYDGIKYSNTKYFEELGWKGICVEPIPEVFKRLEQNRQCICINGCVSEKKGIVPFLWVVGEPEMLSGIVTKFDPVHIERVDREIAEPNSCGSKKILPIQSYLLNDLLEEHGFYHVDFLSIDTEGGEEEIIKSIDFDRYQIDFIDVENNFGDNAIREYLFSKGYKLVVNTGWDDIFQKIL